jgi:hypothetical protein
MARQKNAKKIKATDLTSVRIRPLHLHSLRTLPFSNGIVLDFKIHFPGRLTQKIKKLGSRIPRVPDLQDRSVFIYNRQIGQIVQRFKKELEHGNVFAGQANIQAAGKESRTFGPCDEFGHFFVLHHKKLHSSKPGNEFLNCRGIKIFAKLGQASPFGGG